MDLRSTYDVKKWSLSIINHIWLLPKPVITVSEGSYHEFDSKNLFAPHNIFKQNMQV
jgi:hypothetical protein